MGNLKQLEDKISNYIDCNYNNYYIKGNLKTNKIEQNFSNKNLIPSIESTLLLKNKYEVIEVDSNYKGTLQELLQFYNKKIPNKLPFISILTIGGGSGGGWDKISDTDYIMASYGGSSDFKIITDISLNSNIEIIIGDGGKGKNMVLGEFLSEAPILSNDIFGSNNGSDTVFLIEKQEICKGFGGNKDYKDQTNMIYSKYYNVDIKQLDENEILFQKNALSGNIFSFIRKNDMYIKHNYINYGGLSFDLRILRDSTTSSYIRMKYYLSNEYSSYSDKNINIFLNNFKENYSKIPTTRNEVNSFGVNMTSSSTSNTNPSKAVFFNGLDGIDFGDAGTPGDFTNIQSSNSKYFYHIGSCGSGKQGVCYIYYPSEV